MNTRFSREAAAFRQAIFLATSGGLLIAGAWLMYQVVEPDGITVREAALLVLFVILFGQLAIGFSVAIWGFLVRLFGGDGFQIMRTIPDGDTGSTAPTAVIMPVFNEDAGRVMRAVENMFVSLGETPGGEAFDFFILSDSNQPETWVGEELAWSELCTRHQAFGRIFYRKRRVSLHGKSGNVADFCRRWGQRYRYMIVLDADSVMTGHALVRLTRAMEANPSVGIIQTAPQIVHGTTFLQRMYQFAIRTVGPLFAAGSNFWHLAGGTYWGHNAIIRLQPFMEHCVLPELPGPRGDSRHIMSHDTVEAALMQQAGYQVWFAAEEPGSYEEGPPDLVESFKRDRRWCQGNLQHFWFLFAPRTPFTSRLHIFFGLMAYLSAPLLVVFVLLGAVDFHDQQNLAALSARAGSPEWQNARHSTLLLLGLTVILLFLPKVLGTLSVLVRSRAFGGAAAVLAGSLLETACSVLLAPLYLYFYSKFVLMTILGRRIAWKTQNRRGGGLSLADAARIFWEPTALGLAATTAAAVWVPGLLPWLSPILAGWLLAIPLAFLTGSQRVGLALRRRQLFVIPEESTPPSILKGLEREENPAGEPPGHLGFTILSPHVNALHVSLLKQPFPHPRRDAYLRDIRRRLTVEGPDAISRREQMALLWSPGDIAALHREIWQSPGPDLHPWWRRAMHRISEIDFRDGQIGG